MSPSDYQGKRVKVIASYHPHFGVVAYVASVNRRMRKLILINSSLPKDQNFTAYMNEVEIQEEPAQPAIEASPSRQDPPAEPAA